MKHKPCQCGRLPHDPGHCPHWDDQPIIEDVKLIYPTKTLQEQAEIVANAVVHFFATGKHL